MSYNRNTRNSSRSDTGCFQWTANGGKPSQPGRSFAMVQKNKCRGRLNINLCCGMFGLMTDLKNMFCKQPWEFLHVGADYSSQCCYLSKSLAGLSPNFFYAVWNSAAAQEVRRSILDGDFSYCSKETCPSIQEARLPSRFSPDPYVRNIVDNRILVDASVPSYINLANDVSCNLCCPSCRDRRVTNGFDGKQAKAHAELHKRLLKLIRQNPQKKVTLNISGMGDPFASNLYRDLLFSLDGSQCPNLRIGLQTNGAMFTPKYWQKIKRLWKNLIHIMISMDAATESTYLQIRKGGNWRVLNDNIRHLRQQLDANDLHLYLELSFIVQQKNFREMPLFVELAAEYGFTPATYLIQPWYPSDFFEKVMVHVESHPEFPIFLETLRHPNFDKYPIKWGNLTRFRNLAMGR